MIGKRRPHTEENALLFAVASADSRLIDSMGKLDQLDWDYVRAAADQQGITPLLAHWVQHERPNVPSQIADTFTATHWTTHFRNRTLMQELQHILLAAADEKIDVMPLKGAALAAWYYPALGLRPMSDLDLLVRPPDIARMARLLEAHGYTAVPRPPSLFNDHPEDVSAREYAFVTDVPGMRVLIEYRAEPLDPAIASLFKTTPVMDARYRAHCARMWERSQCAALDTAPCARITPEDLALHVASHLTTRHAGFRLLWLHDLSLIIAVHRNNFDWDYVITEAAQLQLTLPIHAALAAARCWLAAPVAREELERLRDGTQRSSLWEVAERRLFATQVTALGRSNLSAAEPSLPLRPLAISLGRSFAGRALWRGLGRVIVPSRAHMTWWYGARVESIGEYVCAIGSRIAYVIVNILVAGAARLHLHWLAHLMRQLPSSTAPRQRRGEP